METLSGGEINLKVVIHFECDFDPKLRFDQFSYSIRKRYGVKWITKCFVYDKMFKMVDSKIEMEMFDFAIIGIAEFLGYKKDE